jgi:hypothetical protein
LRERDGIYGRGGDVGGCESFFDRVIDAVVDFLAREVFAHDSAPANGKAPFPPIKRRSRGCKVSRDAGRRR